MGAIGAGAGIMTGEAGFTTEGRDTGLAMAVIGSALGDMALGDESFLTPMDWAY